MAVGWLSLLKTVPWSDVVSNAPMVASGARKLWAAVARRSSGSLPHAAVAPTEHDTLSALESRVALLETSAAELHGQMVTSSEVIKALAHQNAQLVTRLETMRIGIRWVSGVLAVLAIVTTGGLLIALSQSSQTPWLAF